MESSKLLEIKIWVLPELFVKLNKRKTKLRKQSILNEIGPEDITSVVARWTGIPVMRLLESEAYKRKMEAILSKE